MKKNMILFASIVVGGVLLSGCGDTGDDEAKTVQAAELEEQTQEVVKAEETRQDILKEEWKVEAAEYTSLDEYLTNLQKNWKEGSEYREVNKSAESTLANAAIAYVNFFEHEIADLGMNEDFDEFQLIADDVVQSKSDEAFEKNVKRFENKMGEILSKIEGTGVVASTKPESNFADIGEWATAMSEMLSEPLNDPKLHESNNDEGFEYYLKSQRVVDSFPKHLRHANEKVEKDFEKIFTTNGLIRVNHGARTSHLDPNGLAMEDAELASQWKPTNDEMREAFKELKQIVDGMANKS